MPLGKSPILQNDLMAEGDNNKFLLFNDALVNLEDAANRSTPIDMTAGNVALTQTQTTRFAVFICSGHTVLRTLTIPITVAVGVSTNRVLIVRNTGTAAVTVTHANGGSNVNVPASTTAIVYGDSINVFSLGGVANSATIPLAEDGVEVVSQLLSLNFEGNGVAVTDDGGGAATVTVTDTKTFSALTDTPVDYVGHAGKAAVVNGTEDGIAFALVPTSGAAIKTLYEGETNTNAYTDAEKTKLAGIEASATADQTGAEIKTLYEALTNTNAYTDAEKTKLAGLASSTFKGTYVSSTALTTAHPAPIVGSYAYVDAGIGSPSVLYIWDDDDNIWVSGGGGGTDSAAVVKSKYESNTDTNAYTDAEQAKLTGIEASATADQTGAEIVAAIDAELGSSTWQSGGGGAIPIKDEGSTIVASPTSLDFKGSLVTVTDVAGVATITIDEPTTSRDTVTSAYSLVAGDFTGRKIKKVNGTSDIIVTVPPSLSVTEPTTVVRIGTGQVTFAAGSGVTINSADARLKLRAQYSSGTLIPDGANNYLLVGDLAT